MSAFIAVVLVLFILLVIILLGNRKNRSYSTEDNTASNLDLLRRFNKIYRMSQFDLNAQIGGSTLF
ncbi:hypothetical protein [Chengkuizengella axinellae]|uniref:Uncharacterized protein n=1 Tax=Chengkuizengella axinellae TaxID=3064388 RepID=A0ABT9J0E6_9BACL|nr:hypothetical protein [Chengkuizengella sp. 2205SS18-9]MDP5275086.1 hypothetical protein [Chengkuizengella sp. 2205SS18-9]